MIKLFSTKYEFDQREYYLKKVVTFEMIFIKEIENFKALLQNGTSLKDCTIQELDFRKFYLNWNLIEIENTMFLGCQFHFEDKVSLLGRGAQIINGPASLPYRVFRKNLYTWQELLAGYEGGIENTRDHIIYKHFGANKYNPSVNEALWQRIHDHAIDDALRDFIGMQISGMPRKKCIGIMGGHGILRSDEMYAKTARVAKILTEKGYLVVSGGGPGIMEAANLGAYFAFGSSASLEEAVKELSKADHYSHAQYIEKGIEVWKNFPFQNISLAVPTWFYGHEPSNVFATHIAKYFSNSIREDILLAISIWGIIFAPGSAGTNQEIFMDAAQNHYGTYGYYSPMVFLGKSHYEQKTMLYPIIKKLAWNEKYGTLLFISDSPEEISHFIENHPPIPVSAD